MPLVVDESLARLIGEQEWTILRLREENARLKQWLRAMLKDTPAAPDPDSPPRSEAPAWPRN